MVRQAARATQQHLNGHLRSSEHNAEAALRRMAAVGSNGYGSNRFLMLAPLYMQQIIAWLMKNGS